jgi:hypothetical protein
MTKDGKKPSVAFESLTSTVDANNFEQKVEIRAYGLYVERGFKDGHDWEDWFEAQKAVEAEISLIDKDCIRSESFYKSSHQSNHLPSEINTDIVIPWFN